MKHVNKSTGLTPAQIRSATKSNTLKSLQEKKSKRRKAKKDRPAKAIRTAQQHDSGLILNLPYAYNHMATELPTPAWFNKSEQVDLSVVVPMYKSSVDEMVDSWDAFCDGVRTELIFVEDACPVNCSSSIVSAWEPRRNDMKGGIGRVYQSSATQGWTACCNIGAEVARGEVVVFLHPEGKLFPGWATALMRLLKKADIGVVGGLHVNESDDSVLEAGREWLWKDNIIAKIGKDSFKGKSLSNAFQMSNTPLEIFQASEREIVSSTLMAVRKKDFIDWGGFCPNLYTREWSDADFCLSVKERGLKVMYQPAARLYRDQLQETDRYHRHGEVYFHNKWIVSGRIDPLVSGKRIQPFSPPTSILVRRSAALGDVLVAAAVVPALKKKYPNSKVTFATGSPQILEGNPYVDRVTEIHSERQFQLFCNLDMAYEYRPNTNMLSAYAESVGVKVKDCRLHLECEPLDVELPDNFIVIHAGKSAWAGRNWSTMRYDQISNRLRKAGQNVVCVGTMADHKTFSCDLDLRSATTMRQLAYVISRAKFFVGADSFPMLVAEIFNVPGVAFFGSIKPETRLITNSVTPIVSTDLPCLGCHHRKSLPSLVTSTCELGMQECMSGISVDKAWQLIEQSI